MKVKSWFRVTVDASGNVTDCRPVASKGSAEGGVFFFAAKTAAAASQLAARNHARLLLAARRAKYRAEGKCKCGGEIDNTAFTTCSRCRDNAKVHTARKQLRKAGIEPPPLDRREALQERKQLEHGSVRFAVLVEVQATFERCRKDPKSFERWLAGQIEKLSSRKESAA
jgi:hypothetical protein